jgi:hypothetical protein
VCARPLYRRPPGTCHLGGKKSDRRVPPKNGGNTRMKKNKSSTPYCFSERHRDCQKKNGGRKIYLAPSQILRRQSTKKNYINFKIFLRRSWDPRTWEKYAPEQHFRTPRPRQRGHPPPQKKQTSTSTSPWFLFSCPPTFFSFDIRNTEYLAAVVLLRLGMWGRCGRKKIPMGVGVLTLLRQVSRVLLSRLSMF